MGTETEPGRSPEISRCPDREELAAYMLGQLPPEIIESIAEHVDACRTCDSTLVAMDDLTDPLVERLQEARDSELPSPESELQRLLALAGDMVAKAPFSSKRTPAEDFTRLGNYELLGELGKGGMGTVYKATHVRLKRVVAVKLLAADRCGDPHAVSRFLREMEAVGKLDHPNIVRAMDAGETDGKYYLAMELIEGTDLKNLVRHRGPLAVADACELVRQAATAVQYAHSRGLLHRDIKPSNLMVTATGQVKVLDLGLARLQIADSSAAGDLTARGQVLGTADYVAPEQGLDSRDADARSDVYSLGCTLYFLLAAQPPLNDPKDDTFAKKVLAHVRSPVPPITEFRDDVPLPLVSVLDRVLAKAPDDRFVTAEELADALLPFAAESDLPGLMEKPFASPPSSNLGFSAIESEALPLPPRQTGLALLAVLIVIGGVFAAWVIQVRSAREDGTTTVVEVRETDNVRIDIDLLDERKPTRERDTETPGSAVGRDDGAPGDRPTSEEAPGAKPLSPGRSGTSATQLPEDTGLATTQTIARRKHHEVVSNPTARRPDPTVPVLWAEGSGGNGHYYQRIKQSATWANAKVLAETMTFQGMKGHLVTITSPMENLFVSNHIMGVSPIWIGLSRKQDETEPLVRDRNRSKPDQWVWVTGELTDYTSWGRKTGHTDFVYMYGGGCWIDGGVFGLPFIVEFEPDNPPTGTEPTREKSRERSEQESNDILPSPKNSPDENETDRQDDRR